MGGSSTLSSGEAGPSPPPPADWGEPPHPIAIAPRGRRRSGKPHLPIMPPSSESNGRALMALPWDRGNFLGECLTMNTFP